MIEAREISFRYNGQTRWILKDFSFRAEPGEIISITGKSGCGKSTLLNILNGVIPKMISGSLQGEVCFLNNPLSEMSLPEISQDISMLMPDPDLQLFFPIVEQELAFGPENLNLPVAEIESRIQKILRILELEDIRFHETNILSFGQKKLTAFAALLTLYPKVYLLDEISSGLSSENIQKIKRIIQSLADQSKVVFLAEHNPDLLELADRTIDFDGFSHVQN
jgi:energy-coupling factor transport system ATP-binding protein